jgi:hypothetical protein
MAQYDYQMRMILENIFDKNDKPHKKNPDNWVRKMTNLVGGTLYQHAHADEAWPYEHEGENISVCGDPRLWRQSIPNMAVP